MPVLHQRFELLAPIGAGGVGTVWRARDRQSGASLALKVLHPHLRGDRVVAERFRREVEIGRTLSHPALVRAFELFEDTDALSFSLELLSGRTLKEAILTGGPLPAEEARRVARRCLEGLGAAHAAGVVHRDFKPQNVFLCDDGEVKLLDFGFARVSSAAGLTTRSLVLCTPDYAAPEVVLARPVDGRADLYALGAVLYEALTGKLPFKGATPFELLQQHLHAPPPSTRALRPDVPELLDALVTRLLAKSPEDRFQTCAAALAALSEPMRPPPAPGTSCPTCQAPRDARWPLCPSCGTTDRGHAAGDYMVVLTRAPARSIPALRRLVESVGARPRKALAREDPAIVRDLPKVVLKGIGEPLARLVRDRALAGELQVELRRQSENTSDLLHKSNTPSYVFALGFALPWGALTFWAIARYIEQQSSALAPLVVGVAGPAIGTWVMKNAWRFLRPLATLEHLEPVRELPPALVARYREVLPRLTDPSLKGTVVRLFERALVVHAAATDGAPHVQMLLEETRAQALAVVERALGLALEAQEALERLGQAGEADLAQELEALRAKLALAPSDAQLAAALVDRERALFAISALEQAHLQASQRLLKAASALEVVAVQALLAHAPTATGVSVEVARVLDEAEFAGTAARRITGEVAVG